MINVKVDHCIHCGLCTRNCEFLKKYELDLSDFAKRQDLAYSCFLCGKCNAVCPKNIDGTVIASQLRCDEIKENGGILKDSSYKGILWEKNPYKFSNYRKADRKSVLFPGCNFPSFYPRTMKYLEQLMRKHGMGVLYECCGKPVYELGLKWDVMESLNKMESRLKGHGVEEIVILCPNCYYFLKDKITIPMTTIYKKLRVLGEGQPIKRARFPVYYPCPDRRNKQMFEDIRFFMDGDIDQPFNKVQCCGLGGCAAAKEPELSTLMVKQAEACGKEMYTYCASCVSNFKRKGYSSVYHVLPEILGVKEEVPLGIQPLINRAKKKIL